MGARLCQTRIKRAVARALRPVARTGGAAGPGSVMSMTSMISMTSSTGVMSEALDLAASRGP
ncbi:MAG: hypothetical protein KC636_39400 [Myxococcales bacterium]|nr:hypothetical protein [Myxococcales bacterium]